MSLKYYEYISLVKEDYKRKRSANQLSLLLVRPTPAKIRQECLNLYKEPHDQKDAAIFRAFFGPTEYGKYHDRIKNFDTDKFKPLHNYLKGQTEKTDKKNIDMLAWLIDFQPRPFVFDMDAPLLDGHSSPSGPENGPVGDQNVLNGEGDSSPKEGDDPEIKVEAPGQNIPGMRPLGLFLNSGKKIKARLSISTFLIAAAFLVSLYLLWQLEWGQALVGNAGTGCMYWTDSCYEEMPCNEERAGRLKLPLDLERMKNFKRITKEDTISEQSIGKVYYSKSNKRLAYYTSGGKNPDDVTRDLHKLSMVIYEKYLKTRNDSLRMIRNGSKVLVK